MPDRYAQVVVEVAPAHLDHPFDYAVPEGMAVRVGQRVRVPFAGRRRPGWVVEVGADPAAGVDPARIRPLAAVDGPWSWFGSEELRLYRWIADRWASTLPAVLRHAVPPRIAAVDREAQRWPEPPPWSAPGPAVDAPWEVYGGKGLLRAVEKGAAGAWWLPVLPGDDPAALVADLVVRCLGAGRGVLVLTADPQSPTGERALAVAGALGADLRGEGGPVDRARYRAALRCRTGHARVAVGGRAAVLAPLRDTGLVIVEDEASPAYKERREPRHHARDVALARARLGGAAAVLTGDLPSAALWRLLGQGHVTALAPAVADRRARAPRVDVLDLGAPRPGTRRARLHDRAARALTAAVRAAAPAALLVTRRGEGTALACRTCGRRHPCPVCDSALSPTPAATVDPRASSAVAGAAPAVARRAPAASDPGAGAPFPGATTWRCATCSWEGAPFACRSCGGTETAPLAAGAGRWAQELGKAHPAADVVRMEGFDAPGPEGRPAIAVMTRGSVVARPAWLAGEQAAVVVIPDADALLGRPRLDAAEDALRLWLAAGHWTRHLVLQTREPANPAVQALVRWDPEGFWRREAERRQELAWPPHRALVRLTLPEGEADTLAEAVRAALPRTDEALGPDQAGEVLVKSADLRGTLGALAPLRHDWGRRSAGVRVDVDPL